MPNVLTFDLGTTFFKACVFDDTGRLLSLARRPTPVRSPFPDWREISPEDFTETLVALALELDAQAPGAYGQVSRVCFATQTNSFLLLDDRDRPLTPIILWNDRRARDLAAPVRSLADSDLRAQTGVPALSTGFAISKLLWLRTHEPDIWRKATRFCLIGDYLTRWLTGLHITEAGAAGLTGLLNIHTLQWRRPLQSALGAEHLSLPEPRYAGDDLGTLRSEAAQRLSLPAGCRIALGCLDQYAGAIGAGNTELNNFSETTGTVLSTVQLSDRFTPELPAAVFQGPAWRPGLWWRMSFSSVSANLLEALRQAEVEPPDYHALDNEAAAVPPGADGLRLDAAASAVAESPVFANLQTHHTRGHRVRALFEAVAETLRDQLRDLCGGSDDLAPIRAVGGAARSDLWLQIKADVLGRGVVAIDCPEPTCRGAALLGPSLCNATAVTPRRIFTPAIAPPPTEYR